MLVRTDILSEYDALEYRLQEDCLVCLIITDRYDIYFDEVLLETRNPCVYNLPNLRLAKWRLHRLNLL